jgi:EamA domain-containing membrane protein RarD
LVITAFLARLLFGERISRLEATGIVTAVAAVTLANLG